MGRVFGGSIMWCYGLSEEFSDGMEARMGITKAFFERVEHADGLIHPIWGATDHENAWDSCFSSWVFFDVEIAWQLAL